MAGFLLECNRENLSFEVIGILDDIFKYSPSYPDKKSRKALTELVISLLIVKYQEEINDPIMLFREGSSMKGSGEFSSLSLSADDLNSLIGKQLGESEFKLRRDLDDELILVKED